jgi:AraC-type DNA-binding domain-containing proteins
MGANLMKSLFEIQFYSRNIRVYYLVYNLYPIFVISTLSKTILTMNPIIALTFLLLSVLIIALLTTLLWRTTQHVRIIKKKNLIMVNTINQLMKHKEEIREKKNPLKVHEPDTTEDANRALFNKLDDIIITQKLYLDRNLNREDLMRLIGVDKNRFGQILKQQNQTNITGYINNLRLNLAVKLLKENPEIIISEVADKCAIPNISTFYRLFKEKYGMTPVEFRNINNGL